MTEADSGRAAEPEPADVQGVVVPYEIDVPYQYLYHVETSLGFTVPFRVPEV